MRPDIAPRGTFPDHELPDHTRVLHRLSELHGLREAWDTGGLSPFHGWNRRAAAAPSAA